MASLKEKITEDLKEAMRRGDTQKRSALRLLLSAIHNAEIAKRSQLENGDILTIIAKEVRQRKESIEAFKAGNREDLVKQEEAELAALEIYLPPQMSREEIAEAARKVIQEVGARGPADKGKVMPRLINELKGRADGREINAVVTELLFQ